jgi:3-phosphoshikimate 1-carboxyvinyltransferase
MHPAESIVEIRPVSRLAGTLRAPGDKSISHRYVMLGSVSRGTVEITNLAPGADVTSTIGICRALGANVTAVGPHHLRILGRGWSTLRTPSNDLDAGNSGTTMRLMAGLLAGRPLRATLTGDASLSRRPMARVLAPLRAMGAQISAQDGHAPITIEGRSLRGITWRPEVPSAQVKSAILLAGLSAAGETTVDEALPTRDHTERAFPGFALEIHTDGRTVTVPGSQEPTAPGAPLDVPGDPSSAAVWAAAAAGLPGSRVHIERVCLNPRRLGFVRALRALGARVTVDQTEDTSGEPVGTISVEHAGHGNLVLDAADVPDLIDELPVLAARAALGGSLVVSGAGELRVKESDRIAALVTGLRALGVEAAEERDGFVIDGSRRPTGGAADAAGDHRLVMAFALVGLGASRPVTIAHAAAVSISYPRFFADLAALTSS